MLLISPTLISTHSLIHFLFKHTCVTAERTAYVPGALKIEPARSLRPVGRFYFPPGPSTRNVAICVWEHVRLVWIHFYLCPLMLQKKHKLTFLNNLELLECCQDRTKDKDQLRSSFLFGFFRGGRRGRKERREKERHVWGGWEKAKQDCGLICREFLPRYYVLIGSYKADSSIMCRIDQFHALIFLLYLYLFMPTFFSMNYFQS